MFEYSRCSKKFKLLLLVKKVNADSADPDQTAYEEAVWSGSSLFAILSSGNHFVNPTHDN